MLDAPRNDIELASLQSHAAVAKLYRHLASPDQEHFVLLFVPVPRKNSGELHELEFLAVQLCNDFRSPMFVDQSELLVQRGFGHTVFSHHKELSRAATISPILSGYVRSRMRDRFG